jgi:hypothetical protein
MKWKERERERKSERGRVNLMIEKHVTRMRRNRGCLAVELQ